MERPPVQGELPAPAALARWRLMPALGAEGERIRCTTPSPARVEAATRRLLV